MFSQRLHGPEEGSSAGAVSVGMGEKSLQKCPMKERTNIRGEDCDETLPQSGSLFIYSPYEAPLPMQVPKSKGSTVRGRE